MGRAGRTSHGLSQQFDADAALTAVYSPFETITSVAFITATTVSPFFSFSSSALRRVMIASIMFCPTRTVTSAITSPILISLTLPLSLFLALMLIVDLLLQ